MSEFERVHWFLREGCNSPDRCAFCFGPLSRGDDASPERDAQLARVLVENGVGNVILGGGEPTSANNLEEVAGILKSGGVYVSLHTNGLRLTEEMLNRWEGLIDDIALPIDAADRDIQRQLRGEGFMEVFDNLMGWAEKINTRGIEVGWHTVFTAANNNEAPSILPVINEQPFKYWRIYEYNGDLARDAWLKMKGVDHEEKIAGFLKARALEKLGTPEKGGTDCLLADFLRMEERIAKLGDNRIQFVARKDDRKEPYAFLNNRGDVSLYAWYGGNLRKILGGVFENGFGEVEQEWKNYRDMKEFDEDEWVEAETDMPLWARLYNGAYFSEEVEEVLPEFVPELERLAYLWQERNQGGDD